jgi:mono/diheme cytochrome c family protein
MAYLVLLILVLVSFGCSMSQEMKRIADTKLAQQRRSASSSTNLTGEQIFIRSCNTCHPQGKQGFGPSIENISIKYPDDQALKALLRKGKGLMPAQPKTLINDEEMDNLIDYIKTL